MSGLLDHLLGLASPWGYIVVGLLAGLEAAAFVGLIIPGETAMLLGGVLVASGRAGLATMMIVASVGAVLGDSLGYEIGRHFGDPIRHSRLGRRISEKRWRKAEEYVQRRGGRAIFLGRFVGVLRALVPAMAGASRMPYRIFLPYNAAGGIVWACGFVFAGYLAGNSYERVAQIAGRASLLLAVVVVAIIIVIVVARWISHHPDKIRGWLQTVGERPFVSRVRRRYATQLGFVGDRLRPSSALGLALTIQLLLLAVFGWLFGGVVQDVLRHEELVQLDPPVARFFLDHSEAWLTHVANALSWVGSVAVLVPLIVATGLYAYRRTSSWRPLWQLVITLAGASALAALVRELVGRPRPTANALDDVPSSAFPSAQATQSVAALIGVALVIATLNASWTRRVALMTVAVIGTVVVGATRIYLGVQAASDVLGGWALGGLWLAATVAAFQLFDRGSQEAPPVAPDRHRMDQPT